MRKNIIRLHIDGQPETCTAQQRKILWKTKMTYLPKKVQQAKARYYFAVKPFAPKEPWDCPIECEIQFHFYQKNGKEGTPKTTKPDLDNAAKLLIDQLARAGFMANDSRIWKLTLSKDFVEKGEEGIDIVLKKTG